MDEQKLTQLKQVLDRALDNLAESPETLDDKNEVMEALQEHQENVQYAMDDLQADIDKELEEDEEDDESDGD